MFLVGPARTLRPVGRSLLDLLPRYEKALAQGTGIWVVLGGMRDTVGSS